MQTPPKAGFLSELKHDLPASLVVFLVAVPLCLGIALASGAPLFSGIIAGIVGGIVVSVLSGSPLGVSGPAAGLAVIVLAAITDLGFEPFLMAVVLSGVIQLALGYLRAGTIAFFFPSSVIRGMLSGIGLVIIIKQIPHMFGYDKDPEGDFAFQQVDGETSIQALGSMMEAITPGALAISLASLALLFLWTRPIITKQKWSQIIQGPLVVVTFGIVMGVVLASTGWSISTDHFVSLPVAGSLEEVAGLFTLPDFGAITNPDIWVTAFTLAIVASLETLLCVEATDKLDPWKRITPPNRELKAQGVGNMVSGFIGGLPLTQVIVRSSANIQSGGRTRASAFFHGILLLVSALAIPGLLNMIPLASLAAVLIVVGLKLAKPSLFKEMYAGGAKQFVPFIATIAGILFTDLLVGIGIGLGVATAFIIWDNYSHPGSLVALREEDGALQLRLAEEVSFLNKGPITQYLAAVPTGGTLVIDATQTRYLDQDVSEILRDYKETANSVGTTLRVEGLDPETMMLLKGGKSSEEKPAAAAGADGRAVPA